MRVEWGQCKKVKRKNTHSSSDSVCTVCVWFCTNPEEREWANELMTRRISGRLIMRFKLGLRLMMFVMCVFFLCYCSGLITWGGASNLTIL